MHIDRRAFVTTMAAGLAAPALITARRQKERYPIAFSTLGCPAWSWETILAQADQLGYAAVELRGVAGEMDLPKVPELSGTRLAGTRRDLSALGIVISDLGASAAMHEKGSARQAQLDEGRRFIDLAHALGVKYVRIFGDRIPPGEPREEVMQRVADGFREMAAHAQPAGVTVIMETHGDFTHSKDVARIKSRVGSDAFLILWDAHHTFVAGGERPAETWSALGQWVRHTHLKDSVSSGPGVEDRRYVLTGTGDVPMKEQVKVLAAGGYKGFYSFEWEKKWHPELEEPEIAFPHYARTMTGYLKEAGVTPVRA
jgi:sugar phosphate isomerase/epimerase